MFSKLCSLNHVMWDVAPCAFALLLIFSFKPCCLATHWRELSSALVLVTVTHSPRSRATTTRPLSTTKVSVHKLWTRDTFISSSIDPGSAHKFRATQPLPKIGKTHSGNVHNTKGTNKACVCLEMFLSWSTGILINLQVCFWIALITQK